MFNYIVQLPTLKNPSNALIQLKSFLDLHPVISVLLRPHSTVRQTRARSSQQVWERENQSENALHWVPLYFRYDMILFPFMYSLHIQPPNHTKVFYNKNNSFKKHSQVDFLLRKVRISGRLNSKGN